MIDSTTKPSGHTPSGPKAAPGRWDGTSPGCLVAIVAVLVVVLGFLGFVAWNAIFIAGYMSDDPALHQDWSWFSTLSIPPIPAVGGAQVTVEGNMVTVHELQEPMQPQPDATLPPLEGGAQVAAAADVEVCATVRAMTGVSVADFNIHGGYSTLGRIRSAAKEPAFPETPVDLALGSCVRGWITYSADTTGSPITVLYDPRGSMLAWTNT